MRCRQQLLRAPDIVADVDDDARDVMLSIHGMGASTHM